MANRVWKLDDLNEKYRGIIEIIKENHLTSIHDRGNMLNGSDGKDTYKLIREIKEKYLTILLEDPFLPKELLPSDWAGEEVKKIIRSLSKIHL